MAGTRLARKRVSAEPTLTPIAASRSGLVATVQPIAFEPGLYCIEISAPTSPVNELGVVLPCLRIEFLPATQTRQGHGTWLRVKEGGWLCGNDPPAFLMVAGGPASALMTSYCTDDGTPGPTVRVTNVPSSLAPEPASTDGKPRSISLAMSAHVTGAGDVRVAADGWLGAPGQPIEGFLLVPVAPFAPADIEYQAILGKDWNTPWVPGGIFCGGRGLQLPIFGFRVRVGKAWPEYECIYSGRFANGATSGPHTDGEPCQVADKVLEAMHVVITRRTHIAGAAK